MARRNHRRTNREAGNEEEDKIRQDQEEPVPYACCGT